MTCKVTLVTFLGLLFAVPQNICYKITLIAFVRFSPLCVLIWAQRVPGSIQKYLHRWHLLGFSPLCVFIWVRIDAKSQKLHYTLMHVHCSYDSINSSYELHKLWGGKVTLIAFISLLCDFFAHVFLFSFLDVAKLHWSQLKSFFRCDSIS